MPTLLLDVWGAALQISVLYHDRPEFPSKTVHTHTLDTAAGDTASCALGAKKEKNSLVPESRGLKAPMLAVIGL